VEGEVAKRDCCDLGRCYADDRGRRFPATRTLRRHQKPTFSSQRSSTSPSPESVHNFLARVRLGRAHGKHIDMKRELRTPVAGRFNSLIRYTHLERWRWHARSIVRAVRQRAPADSLMRDHTAFGDGLEPTALIVLIVSAGIDLPWRFTAGERHSCPSSGRPSCCC
jgi:hypothetical protein